MTLLTDKFWRENKPLHLDDMTHNGEKYVLGDHSHFFEKFLEMFQTCTWGPNMILNGWQTSRGHKG